MRAKYAQEIREGILDYNRDTVDYGRAGTYDNIGLYMTAVFHRAAQVEWPEGSSRYRSYRRSRARHIKRTMKITGWYLLIILVPAIVGSTLVQLLTAALR